MASASVYTLSKRHNSTLQPTGTGTVIDVYLKGGSDLLSPVFTLNSATIPTFNYLSFEGRYYFVIGIRNVRDQLYEVSCQVDVLATYKNIIQATSAYVLYYTHANTQIVDRRLSTKTDITIDNSTQTFNNLGSGESYMLTAIGEERTSIFACDKSKIDELFESTVINSIKSGWDGMIANVDAAAAALTTGNVQDMIRDVFRVWLEFIKTQGNVTTTVLFCDDAQKFVKNCFVLPIDKSNIGGSLQMVHLGKWIANANGNTGFPRICHDSATLAIPWQATDWRRNEPYHEIYLYIPYIGLINIPASEVIGVTNITVNVAIDTYSGVTSFVVNADNGAVLGQYSTNIAAPYAVGSSNINLTASGAQIVASAAAIAGGIASGNIGGISMGALGIVNAIKPFDSSISSNGGAAGMGLGNTVKCFTVFHDTTVTPSSISAVKGTPYNGVLSLSGISGYVQTMDASVAGSMTDTEREEINNLLNGGVYIE